MHAHAIESRLVNEFEVIHFESARHSRIFLDRENGRGKADGMMIRSGPVSELIVITLLKHPES
jgi:hypothetical protein